jgi:hypothetical protein
MLDHLYPIRLDFECMPPPSRPPPMVLHFNLTSSLLSDCRGEDIYEPAHVIRARTFSGMASYSLFFFSVLAVRFVLLLGK